MGARRLAEALLLGASLVLATNEAHAQGSTERAATAQGLFEAAAELIRDGNYASACPKLEESQRLDPAVTTQFFLATCYENTGRPTTAWSIYLDVAAAAKSEGNSVREATARGHASALEPKLPRIRVAVPEAVEALPGLAVWRDGIELRAVVFGAPVPVDLGDHVVRVMVPGKPIWESHVTLRELGERIVVKVPASLSAPSPPVVGAPSTTPSLPTAASSAPRRGPLGRQRTAAVIVISVGLAGIAVGAALGLAAQSAWHDAESGCPRRQDCSAAAHDTSVRSVGLATGSTIGLVAGGAAVVTGAVLWFATPRTPAVRVRVAALPSQLGLVAEGRF